MNPRIFNLSRIKITLITILLIIAVSMTMGSRAHAFEWFPANQRTVAWDAVTLKTDDAPIDATDTIEYSVYLANSITDPNKTNPVQIWRGPETQTLITLVTEGSYFVGVRSHRMLEDGTEVGESTIAWSDDPLATGANGEFGVQYFLGPKEVQGLRPQP